ncbi:HAD family hydrolase [Moritella dasanensis]|uniref:HAD family hydrolase n=1 Tax=Moritella dasanensis TaxID=428031 RepID=UPI00031110AF|nr:hypothetical protein [Moritella dasanensis]
MSNLLITLKNKIDEAGIVSFDFFDTLFTRACIDPEDVFHLVANKCDFPDFKRVRKESQIKGFQLMHNEGRNEITFDDIYKCFDVDKEKKIKLQQSEQEVEELIVKPNPEMLPVFEYCIAQGKKVVIVSDMYISKDFFINVLKSNGFPEVDLYVSCDENATKRDCGHLFDLVVKNTNIEPRNIFHIGDNYHADVVKAEERGLIAHHYHPFWDIKETDIGNVELSTSIAYGVQRLNSINNVNEKLKKIGYDFAGPLAIGYLQWIHEQSKKDDIDLLLFVSRDGYILEHLSNLYPNQFDLPAHKYFLSSRVLLITSMINDQNFHEFIPYFLSGSDGLSAFEILERIGVASPSKEVMADLGLDDNLIITPELYSTVAQFIFAMRWEILKVCRRNLSALYEQVQQLEIKPGMKVAMVDVGWNGTMQKYLDAFLRDNFGATLSGYYIGLTNQTECVERRQSLDMKAMFDPNIESENFIGELFDSRVLVELLFSAPHESIIGLSLDKKGKLNAIKDKGRGRVNDHNTISVDIIDGASKFFHDYLGFINKLELNIDGYDLSRSIIHHIKNKDNSVLFSSDNMQGFDAWGSSKNISKIEHPRL